MVESRLPLRTPKWEADPDFALEHHMHHRALPAPGDERALQELVSDLMTMPLDRSRPLWHVYLVDGYGDGAAIITRMHHCIADGISLARVMLSLADSEPESGISGSRREGARPSHARGGRRRADPWERLGAKRSQPRVLGCAPEPRRGHLAVARAAAWPMWCVATRRRWSGWR